MENMNYDMAGFTSPDFRSEKNRVKMVYALLTSNEFFHQEVSVLNPTPTQFHPDFLAPRDFAVYSYRADSADTAPSLEELQRLMEKYQSPFVCVASQDSKMDRSFQLLCLPEHNKSSEIKGSGLLIINFIASMSVAEKERIASLLMKAYNALQAEKD